MEEAIASGTARCEEEQNGQHSQGTLRISPINRDQLPIRESSSLRTHQKSCAALGARSERNIVVRAIVGGVARPVFVDDGEACEREAVGEVVRVGTLVAKLCRSCALLFGHRGSGLRRSAVGEVKIAVFARALTTFSHNSRIGEHGHGGRRAASPHHTGRRLLIQAILFGTPRYWF